MQHASQHIVIIGPFDITRSSVLLGKHPDFLISLQPFDRSAIHSGRHIADRFALVCQFRRNSFIRIELIVDHRNRIGRKHSPVALRIQAVNRELDRIKTSQTVVQIAVRIFEGFIVGHLAPEAGSQLSPFVVFQLFADCPGEFPFDQLSLVVISVIITKVLDERGTHPDIRGIGNRRSSDLLRLVVGKRLNVEFTQRGETRSPLGRNDYGQPSQSVVTVIGSCISRRTHNDPSRLVGVGFRLSAVLVGNRHHVDLPLGSGSVGLVQLVEQGFFHILQAVKADVLAQPHPGHLSGIGLFGQLGNGQHKHAVHMA